ncbi:hypothetical protein GPA27_26750 [Aromatoleum toluolicum]|uniref:Uncharacterized protein n=1 Tax=Aromatoleum toluolicum TaxID=90060 RepID=A0ABX1NNN5_9RHOO|nr:hypothetical protein [Aromatoleum toluolicum]NMG00978.1 hypothetical protein [Aromatoleum toluolicum]
MEENAYKRGIEREVIAIKQADPFIGLLTVDKIYNETLADMKKALATKGQGSRRASRPAVST